MNPESIWLSNTPMRVDSALENLIMVLQKDLDHGNGSTRKALLDTIASLGKGDPLAAEFQRKLYSLIY